MEMDWKIRGGHKQATREGYNLFQTIGNTANTSQGLTITTDDDGVVTINGTANVAYAEIIKNKEITDKLMDGETYTIWQSTVSQYCYMQILAIDFDGKQTYYPNSNTNITTFVVNKTKYAKYLISVTGGQNATSYTFNNFKIAFMLLKGSYTANTVPPYEAYGVSPSLDYPSEIETVGNNVNIFDFIDFTTKDRIYNHNCDVTVLKNGFRLTKTGVDPWLGAAGIKTGYLIEVTPNTTYTISTSTKFYKCYVNWFTKEQTYIRYRDFSNTTKYTFTTDENTYYVSFRMGYNDDDAYKDFLDIKLEKGTVATPYSPYGMGSVEMNKSNKNIFDIDTMIELTNQYREYLRKGKIQNLNNFNGLKIPVESGHEYILSTDSTLANNLCFFDKNMNFLGGYADNRSFVVPENCRYVTYAIQNDYTWIQFEENPEKTPYVEHKGQTYIMPIQQEMLTGDYINDVEHHWLGKYVFTGEEDFKLISNQRFQLNLISAGLPRAINKYYEINAMSNCFQAKSLANSSKNNTVAANDDSLYIRVNEDTTLDMLKTILKEKYEVGNPIVIYYKLAEPIDLELTEEQKAIREQKLHTYKNVTNISLSNELASIDVTYKKDLETEHNKLQEKNNNLQSQIDEIKQLLSTTETSAMLINNLQKDVEMEVK